MTFLTILFAILVFSVIIFVHELGHFISARIFGVTVHEFSVGMGPAIWKKQGKKETLYAIRCIPVGGYCKMEGEDDESDSEGSFSNKSKFARIVILASGALMNIVLGFVISLVVVLMTMNGGIATKSVDKVVSEAPVAAYIKPGDEITEINGKSIHIYQDVLAAVSFSGDRETFDVTVKRDGEIIELQNIDFYEVKQDGKTYKKMGISFDVNKNPGFFTVIHESFFQGVYMGKIVFMSLGMLIRGDAGVRDLSGPVGVVSSMGQVAANSGGGLAGFINLLFLAGFISVNIGIMNLLPFPALDGGRIFFILIEIIIRRKIPADKEGIVHFVGLILLFGLMIFATWNDILRLIGG